MLNIIYISTVALNMGRRNQQGYICTPGPRWVFGPWFFGTIREGEQFTVIQWVNMCVFLRHYRGSWQPYLQNDVMLYCTVDIRVWNWHFFPVSHWDTRVWNFSIPPENPVSNFWILVTLTFSIPPTWSVSDSLTVSLSIVPNHHI